MNEKTALIECICRVCGQPRHPHPLAYCCKSCKRLLDRIETRGRKPDRNAREWALHESWDGHCFRCYYTNWPLVLDNPDSPYYLTWEHRTPGIESDVVVAAALINYMKADLTETEFRTVVEGLARRFNDSSATVAMINPAHFRRAERPFNTPAQVPSPSVSHLPSAPPPHG
jgi:hypothetical protein